MEFTIADTLKKARLNCELSRISPSADAYRITQDGLRLRYTKPTLVSKIIEKAGERHV